MYTQQRTTNGNWTVNGLLTDELKTRSQDHDQKDFEHGNDICDITSWIKQSLQKIFWQGGHQNFNN